MCDEQYRFLTLRQLPVRVTAEQVGWLVNCQVHDVPILMSAKLLKPLGNPPQNGAKFFATKEVLDLSRDEKWLHRVTAAITHYWQEQNQRKRAEHRNEPAMLAA